MQTARSCTVCKCYLPVTAHSGVQSAAAAGCPCCYGQHVLQLSSLTPRGKVEAPGAAGLEIGWNYCPGRECYLS